MNSIQGFDALHDGFLGGLRDIGYALQRGAERRSVNEVINAYNALVRRYNVLARERDAFAREIERLESQLPWDHL